MKRTIVFVGLALSLMMAVGCGEAADAASSALSAIQGQGASVTASPEGEAAGGVVVAEDVEFIPVGADAKDFDALKKALADDSIDEITLEKNVNITENVTVEKTIVIQQNITLTIEPGVGLYIDNGLVENNGAILVSGAAKNENGNPDCGILAVMNGGGIVNAGTITLSASALSDGGDSPLGGQLRLNGGTLENNGSVAFLSGSVANAGGVGDISQEGAFLNNATVEMNGAFLRITGRFVNAAGASLAANGIIYVENSAEFDNSGALSGTGTINDTPIGQYQN